GGALFMAEAQLVLNKDKSFEGTYKLGGWYATADYADQRFGLDANGLVVSLASPDVVDPLNRRGNFGIYAIADQMIWSSGEASANVFMRAAFAPGDRNLIASYIDGGIGLKGFMPRRPEDTLTFGIAHSQVSADAAALDRDMLAFNGPPFPFRDNETVLE